MKDLLINYARLFLTVSTVLHHHTIYASGITDSPRVPGRGRVYILPIACSTRDNLLIPQILTLIYGPSGFTVSVPISWNSLPPSLHGPYFLLDGSVGKSVCFGSTNQANSAFHPFGVSK